MDCRGTSATFRWHDYLSEQAQFVCAAGKRLNAGACRCQWDKDDCEDLGIVKVIC